MNPFDTLGEVAAWPVLEAILILPACARCGGGGPRCVFPWQLGPCTSP